MSHDNVHHSKIYSLHEVKFALCSIIYFQDLIIDPCEII